MNRNRIVALVLVVVGIAALIYGGFTYTTETHDAEIGPIEFSVAEKETVNIPVWVGVAAVLAGTGVLFLDRKR